MMLNIEIKLTIMFFFLSVSDYFLKQMNCVLTITKHLTT